jgi:Tfp pilus assembly protein PilO
MKNSTAFILILISAGMLYVFILPQYDQVNALKANQAQYQNILQNVSALEAKRDELLVKYQNIPQQRIDELFKVLPDNVDTVSLAMNLDTIASHYGISIKSIQTAKDNTNNSSTIVVGAPTSAYGAVTFNFSFITTYANFRKFMQDIEKSLRITDIQSVSFQSATNGLYEYQVSIKTYWLK